MRLRRFKLGRHASAEGAATAYDSAATALGVPSRCNFGSGRPDSWAAVECGKCGGLGLVGGEHKRPTRRMGTYIARLGGWRDCPPCGGRGYFLCRAEGPQPCCICAADTALRWRAASHSLVACSLRHAMRAACETL